MRLNIRDIEGIKNSATKVTKKSVGEMISKETEKNIYQNVSGHEQEPNYTLYDLGAEATGLERHVVSLTILEPGKVNQEFKMTTGHSHEQEEVYQFLSGAGKLILREQGVLKSLDVVAGDYIPIASNTWHRVVNTGSRPLEVLCVFEKYSGRG